MNNQPSASNIFLSPDRYASTQNIRGEWVPAIPMPFFGGLRKRCPCGARFWTLKGYEGHYALEHILGLVS